jgi:tetratricopeptide (TPR) repeat protein
MKRICLTVLVISGLIVQAVAQKTQDSAQLDVWLLQGNYQQVIETGKTMVKNDTLNPEIYYKIGIACQNLHFEDQALKSFQKAAALKADNPVYNFALAKALYGDEKYKMAEPILNQLCSLDSMNWTYAWYLTGIYMQNDRFDDALRIYDRFWKKDSANYVFSDKIAFAYLKKGDLATAKDWYNHSLSINRNNLIAIKNLSWLYATTQQTDTAIQILSEGIKIDPTEMDLYVRRALINFSKNYTKRALDDYLVLLAAGDSSTLFLKRAGIGYCYNLQPKEAVEYLLKAYRADSTDYETCNFLGQSYFNLKDIKNSILYYNRAIKILSTVNAKLALTHNLMGDSQKEDKNYKGAVESYLKAYAISQDPNLNLVIANLYDDKLHNPEKAIFYYQRFMNTYKNSRMALPPEYIETVEKRLGYLKESRLKPKYK